MDLLTYLKSQLLIEQAELDCLIKRFEKTMPDIYLHNKARVAEIQRQIDELEFGDIL